MTVIKLEATTPEFKKGFRSAMKMILNWCKHKDHKTIDDLEMMLTGGLMLDDLMNKEMNEK
jgi:hypothetical protein